MARERLRALEEKLLRLQAEHVHAELERRKAAARESGDAGEGKGADAPPQAFERIFPEHGAGAAGAGQARAEAFSPGAGLGRPAAERLAERCLPAGSTSKRFARPATASDSRGGRAGTGGDAGAWPRAGGAAEAGWEREGQRPRSALAQRSRFAAAPGGAPARADLSARFAAAGGGHTRLRGFSPRGLSAARREWAGRASPPPPSRTKWTLLVHPSVLIGHVSSL